MRKNIFAVVLVVLLFCTSCAVQQGAPASRATIGSESKETSAQTEGSTEVSEIVVLGQPILYGDIYELVEASDIIIIGTIEEALPVVRIEAVSLGLVSGPPEYYKNVSSYQVRIEQVFKGEFNAGEQFRVDRNGGVAEGIFENHVGLNYPVEGLKYLMFINEMDFTDKTDYFKYMFEGTFDGFSEIVDGKLYPQELTSIFESGTPIEEVIARITDAMEGRPPIESE